MDLFTDFERLDELDHIEAELTSIRQRCVVVDKMSSRLQRALEDQRIQLGDYLVAIEHKTREIEHKTEEIDRLTVALRTADDEASQERERQHVLIARLRASVSLNRI